MSSSSGLSWFLGGPFLLLGLTIILWSWRLWRKPESLNPSSILYRYFYLDYQTWPRRNKENSGRLTGKQIRYYAFRGVLGGILLIMAGIALLVQA